MEELFFLLKLYRAGVRAGASPPNPKPNKVRASKLWRLGNKRTVGKSFNSHLILVFRLENRVKDTCYRFGEKIRDCEHISEENGSSLKLKFIKTKSA